MTNEQFKRLESLANSRIRIDTDDDLYVLYVFSVEINRYQTEDSALAAKAFFVKEIISLLDEV